MTFIDNYIKLKGIWMVFNVVLGAYFLWCQSPFFFVFLFFSFSTPLARCVPALLTYRCRGVVWTPAFLKIWEHWSKKKKKLRIFSHFVKQPKQSNLFWRAMVIFNIDNAYLFHYLYQPNGVRAKYDIARSQRTCVRISRNIPVHFEYSK